MTDSSSHPREAATERAPVGSVLINAVAAGGVLLIFVLILLVVYLPNQPAPLLQEANQRRIDAVSETRSTQVDAAQTYDISQDGRVNRIPVERAMELVVREAVAGADGRTVIALPSPESN